jgi:uncharacterized membrane protein YfcA
VTLADGIVVFVAGVVAGVANVIAGGGSLLAVPILIFAGQSPIVANASSRPAIIAQCLVATIGFHRAGVFRREAFARSSTLLALVAVPAAIFGATIASRAVSDAVIRSSLAIALAVVFFLTLHRRRSLAAGFQAGRGLRWALLLPFFLAIGFYGGFVQAGVGFFIFAALAAASDHTLVEINAARSWIVLIYTAAAAAVFAGHETIEWTSAGWLIAGQAAGGFLGAMLAIRASERFLLDAFLLILALFSFGLLAA